MNARITLIVEWEPSEGANGDVKLEDYTDVAGYIEGTVERVFHEVSWAHHQGWAMEYCRKHFPDVDDSSPFFQHDDYLLKRGWILLHNTVRGPAVLEKGGKEMTKRQKEFLYDYYMERGRETEANDVWEEE